MINSSQARGKALSRVTRVLPKSPRRKMAVAKRRANNFGVFPTSGSVTREQQLNRHSHLVKEQIFLQLRTDLLENYQLNLLSRL